MFRKTDPTVKDAPSVLPQRPGSSLCHHRARVGAPFGAPPAFPASSTPGTTSPVASENARQGSKDWELSKPATNREIEGYASNVSVRPRETVRLHVSTASKTFDIEIYRLGWYGGLGARLVFRVVKIRAACARTPRRVRKMAWLSAAGRFPTRSRSGDWVSGVYLAKLTASGTGRQAYMPFVVLEKRGLAHPAPFLFQCSVTTWQAYNAWGGKSLYDFNSTGEARARRVSFNRPYGSGPGAWAGVGAGEVLTMAHVSRAGGWEYPMIRWLERNGYDVAYATNIDVDADPGVFAGPARDAHRGARRVLVPSHARPTSRRRGTVGSASGFSRPTSATGRSASSRRRTVAPTA